LGSRGCPLVRARRSTAAAMAPAGLHASILLGADTRGKATVQSGRRLLQQPRGLQFTPDGSLLVADFGSHCVLRFPRGDVKGAVVAGEAGKALVPVDPLKDIDRPLGPAEGEGYKLMRPLDVCEDAEGGILVLDAEANRLQCFSKQSGPAATLVPPPRGPPQKSSHSPEAIKGPRAMLLEANGNIILCDTWSHRILRYVKDGEAQPPEEVAGTPNSFGRRPDQLAFPSGVALDAEGRLLVADTNNHRIQRFSPGERVATTVAGSETCASGSGPGELNMPTGLCVDPRDGSIVVADRGNKRILRFAAGSCAGVCGEVLAGPDVLECPWGVCLDSAGSVLVSDERRGLVFKLSVSADDGTEASAPPAATSDNVQLSAVAEPPAAPRAAAPADTQPMAPVQQEADGGGPAPPADTPVEKPLPPAEPAPVLEVASKGEVTTLISGDPMELD